MKKKKKVIIVLSAVFIAIFLYINRPPKIIAIPGGQIWKGYGTSHYTFCEYYVVVNPPRNLKALKKLIIEYDRANPIAAPPPPMNAEWVDDYSRRFFRESNAFPRDIEFTSSFRPEDVITEDYQLRDMIALVDANLDETNYRICLISWEIPWLDAVTRTYDYHTELNTDPSVNGLYNNVPEHKITKRR